MRLIAVLLTGLAVIACTEDGYKGLPPIMNGSSVGDGIDYVDNNAHWKYGSKEEDGIIMSVSAVIYSTNTYFNHKASLTLKKYINSGVKKTISFRADSGFYCGSACTVPIKFNNKETKAYSMKSSNGELTPVRDSDGVYLFNQFTKSNEATAWLPIAGRDAPFEAKFNLRGYDVQKMALSMVATPITTPLAPTTPIDDNTVASVCDSMVKKACTQISNCVEAKQQLQCGNNDLDGNDDGVPCEKLCL